VCNKLQAHKSWENNLNKDYSFSKFSSAMGRNISLHFHQVGVSNGQAYPSECGRAPSVCAHLQHDHCTLICANVSTSRMSKRPQKELHRPPLRETQGPQLGWMGWEVDIQLKLYTYSDECLIMDLRLGWPTSQHCISQAFEQCL